MQHPLVSVIIPTHNRLALLRQAIDSVLAQDYPNLELFVIDDGSNDGTRAAMVAAPDPRVRYLHQRCRGAAAARNSGLRLARGTYVAFLDSDDLWLPGKLAQQIAYLEGHPEIGMLSSNFRLIDSAGRVLADPGQPYGYQPGPDFIVDVLEVRYPMSTTTTVLRQSALDRVGPFNEQLRIAEDLDLWLRIGFEFPVAYLDQVHGAVRLHQHHLMRETPRYQVWLDSVRVLERHRRRIAERVADADAHFARFYAYAGNAALLDGRRATATGLYLRALRQTPLAWGQYKNLGRCLLPLALLRLRHAARRPAAASAEAAAQSTLQLYQ